MFKTLIWDVSGSLHTIKSIPYVMAGDEEVLNANVAITVAMLKELMMENAIPSHIDYQDFKDVKAVF